MVNHYGIKVLKRSTFKRPTFKRRHRKFYLNNNNHNICVIVFLGFDRIDQSDRSAAVGEVEELFLKSSITDDDIVRTRSIWQNENTVNLHLVRNTFTVATNFYCFR